MNPLKKILVVDDEAEIRNLLFDLLSDRGFQVTLAKDGRESLKRMEKVRFDLLITDIQMPHLDGIAMLKRMKKEKRREKVIVISGMPGDRADLGGKDVLPVFAMLHKPFRVKRFLDAVATVLKDPIKKLKKESHAVRYH
ncbi:MAG: response regulator [Desulfobacteraceae bacterium]|nr:MAG: response regulator [Desulfobacteraceae bacterium]